MGVVAGMGDDVGHRPWAWAWAGRTADAAWHGLGKCGPCVAVGYGLWAMGVCIRSGRGWALGMDRGMES